MTKRVYADTRLALFLTKRVLELRPKKSQLEIASEAGYPNPNMIAMLKSGASKLALDRVPSLAGALDCDPAHLLRMALEQDVGDTAARALMEIMGSPVTANERGWVDEIRSASSNSDPRMTVRGRTAIRAVFGQ